MSDLEVSIEQEISQIAMGKPHVVLVGAGASRAALPHGDRSGKRMPLMGDFTEIVPVARTLERAGVQNPHTNFELQYAAIASDPSKSDLRTELEHIIYSYFNSLSLPDEVTLYDLLVLSLRSKDVIATFNWDPFLIQAVRRNAAAKASMPRIAFLHGNVLSGYCRKDAVHGTKGTRCSKCGEPFEPSRLLFPISAKDYHADPMIANAWKFVEWALSNAFMLTVFGYGAPSSDQSAMDLLKGAWGGSQRRNMEQVEIIDVRSEDDLTSSWDAFIHTHHYDIFATFAESWIGKHPRRTGEAYLNQYLFAKFISDNPVSPLKSLPSLWDWFRPLISVEEANQRNDRSSP